MDSESELRQLGQRIASLETELQSVRAQFNDLSARKPSSGSAHQAAGSVQPAPAASARPPQPAPRPSRPGFWDRLKARHGGEWEFFLGGNLLGKLGILALVLAAAWFIKLAIDNRWINEAGRIYLGLLGGFLITAGGLHLARKGYRLLAPALTGAGAAVVYIAFFGAFYFYGLIGRTETFVGLTLLSAALAFLSYRSGAQLLYVFSFVGAFLAPMLLSSGANSYRFLFGYLTLINLGFLVVSMRHPWRTTPFVLLGLNVLVFSAWSGKIAVSSLSVPLLYVVALLLIFLYRECVTVPARYGAAPRWDSYLLLLGANIFAGVAGYALLDHFAESWTGHYFLLLAAFVLGGHVLGQKRATHGLALQGGMLTLFLIWVFTSVTDYFSGSSLTTAWLTLAGGVSLFGAWGRTRFFLVLSLPLWVIALFRLLFIESPGFDPLLLLNRRFALFVLATALAAGTYLVQRKRPVHGALRGFAFSAIAILLIGCLKEAHDFVQDPHYRTLAYSYVMALFAVTLLVPGFRFSWKSARWSGIVLAVMVVSKLYAYDIWKMSNIVRVLAFATLGAALIAVSYYYQRFRDRLFPKSEADLETRTNGETND